MLDEQDFRRADEAALQGLKQHLAARKQEPDSGFEVAEQSGTLHVLFEDMCGKFVVAPEESARQIWISALATFFKLDWDSAARDFILPRTGEPLVPLVDRLIEECAQSGPLVR